MAFVRKKAAARGNTYYQLVEARRVDGKPRQRVLIHLGRHDTVDAALKAWPREVGHLRRQGYGQAADELQHKLARLKEMRASGVA